MSVRPFSSKSASGTMATSLMQPVTLWHQQLNTAVQCLMQSNIEAVKSGIQGKIPANQLAEVRLKLIDEDIEDMRYTLPVTEGKTNVTVLDTQIQNLRSRFLSQIHEAALRMRSEATDVKSTLLEIEEWLDKLMQLTEEKNLYKDVMLETYWNLNVIGSYWEDHHIEEQGQTS
ncbi:myoferlin-like isoform X1 [Apodemus sylvaticus]|uniref:myoferlin-like isoform X1 n=1 Tax=Apodemus sylvaticus TaxID=10129 RepID=UPI0022430FC1|nr:myoferlin-like isoform X1 [Apodemus sylvaticus]XP_052042594.1 myoferlin-like isoform X1 [Apodemus sylvaticus]